MNFLRFNNGILMPQIGFGTVGLNGDEGKEIVISAIQNGYTLIDTAQMYDNEKMIGQAVNESGVQRNKLFITTKLNEPNNSYELAKDGISRSLDNLQMDYIDLCLIHEPYSNSMDMYKALIEAYEKGLIKAIGISNFNIRRYKEFLKECGIIPTVNQIESNVFYPQDELIKVLKENGTIAQAWSPFAGGKRNINSNPTLSSLASKYDKTPNQLALRYLIQKGIGVIPKSHNVDRMKQNLDVFDFEISQIDMELLKTLDMRQSACEWMKNWE